LEFGAIGVIIGRADIRGAMASSWSLHPRSARVGFTSCCVVFVLESLSLFGVGKNVSSNVQYSLFALFCLALGFAAFSLAREQSKAFGIITLLVGLISFAIPYVLLLWFPGLLRH
jgi:hypothetical protein